ncbi:MAG: TlpA family protein disulfide reductase [Acidimicrobiales bacterium]
MITTTPDRVPSLRLLAIAVVAALVFTACGSSSEGSDALPGLSVTPPDGAEVATSGPVEPAAEDANFTYDTFEEGTKQLADLPEGPVVVNFFASWCPTCIAEMPDFEKVHQAVGGDVTFLGLALQDRPESAQVLVADTGVTYDIGLDEGDIFEKFGGLGMPTTVFIDADGVVQQVFSGGLTEDALMDIINEKLLEEA